jgi:hypothetical protein
MTSHKPTLKEIANTATPSRRSSENLTAATKPKSPITIQKHPVVLIAARKILDDMVITARLLHVPGS